ncbi:MAG TPA: hypothetical protein PKV00_12275 [Thauera sp.]|nr:hypothetical protein [Thauera sp.]
MPRQRVWAWPGAAHPEEDASHVSGLGARVAGFVVSRLMERQDFVALVK